MQTLKAINFHDELGFFVCVWMAEDPHQYVVQNFSIIIEGFFRRLLLLLQVFPIEVKNTQGLQTLDNIQYRIQTP